MSRIDDFMVDHPIIFTIISVFIIGAVLVGAIIFFEYAEVGFRPFHYEYIDANGETQEAVCCSVPYRSQARCKLKDGTIILDIKSYRKVADE